MLEGRYAWGKGTDWEQSPKNEDGGRSQAGSPAVGIVLHE